MSLSTLRQVTIFVLSANLSLAQQTTGSLTGRLTGSSGLGLVGIQVTLIKERDRQPNLHSQTSSDGAYTFSDLELGKYSLEVDGPFVARALITDVEISTGDIRVLPDLQLEIPRCGAPELAGYFRPLPESEGHLGALSGNIISQNLVAKSQAGAQGAEIDLFCHLDGSEPCRITTPDAKGDFRFPGLQAGLVSVQVSRKGYFKIYEDYLIQSGWERVQYPMAFYACPQGNCKPKGKVKVIICQ